MGSSTPAQTRRMFVAVSPPDEAVTHLGIVVDSLEVSRADAPGSSTRVAPRDRWHVTLAFLGDVPVTRIDTATHALSRAVAYDDGTSPGEGATSTIRVCLAGGGTFGRGRFTILWCGLGGDIAALRRLAAGVRTELRRAHLPFDRKGFRPHLTISRPGGRVAPRAVAADVATLDAYAGPLWTVEAVHLVASDIEHGATGPVPRYTRLSSVPLLPRPVEPWPGEL
jgi:2'-5' RNA ligase